MIGVHLRVARAIIGQRFMLIDVDFLSRCDAIIELDASKAAVASLIEECDELSKDKIGRDIVIEAATPTKIRKRKVSLQLPIEVVDKKKKKRKQQHRTEMRNEKADRR